MNVYRYNRVRMLQMFILITTFAALMYVCQYYYFMRTEGEGSSKPVRNTRFITQQYVTDTGSDVMSERIKSVNARCHDDIIIRNSKRFRFPIAANSNKPFYRYKHAHTCMCKVPKVASTMLSKLLLATEYPMNFTYIQNMPGYYVHDANLTSQFQRDACSPNDELKFIVVRNPYSRIYSAYIDKVFLGKFKAFSAKVQYFTGQNKSARSYFDAGFDASKSFMCKGHDVTFDSFLRWILFHYKVDWHFAPITTFCNPCENPFDVIIKQENSRDEMKYVTEHIPVSMDTSGFTEPTNENKIRDLIAILNDLLEGSMLTEHCGVRYTNFTFVNERFWDSLKMQGYISRHQRMNTDVFRPYSSAEAVFNRFKALKVPFLNSEQRSAQRQEYLVNAYKSLDEDLIRHFKFRFHADFHLFGYSLDPPS